MEITISQFNFNLLEQMLPTPEGGTMKHVILQCVEPNGNIFNLVFGEPGVKALREGLGGGIQIADLGDLPKMAVPRGNKRH